MRRGELLRLRWEHVDFHKGEIKVTNTKSDRDRFVPMNGRVRGELLRLRDETEGDLFFPVPSRAGAWATSRPRSTLPAEALGLTIFIFTIYDIRSALVLRMPECRSTRSPL